MENINMIILGIFALLGIVGALVGFGKGLIKSAVKVASIIFAVMVAFAITPTLLQKAYQLALPVIEPLLENFKEIFEASPTLAEYIPTLITCIISPVVFLALFVACLVIVAILRAIVLGILKFLLPQKAGLISRVCGLALGGVGGVIIALCFVFPVTGYFTAVPKLYSNMSQTGMFDELGISAEMEQIIVDLPNGEKVKLVNDSTKDYFNQLVSYEVDGNSVSALDDLVTITSLVPPVMDFVGSMGDIATMDVTPIYDINGIIGQSVTLRTIVAEVVSSASIKWLAGEPFVGFNLKDQLGEYRDALDGVLAKLATSNKDNVVENLNELADTIVTMQHVYVYVQMLQNGFATLDELESKLADVLQSVDQGTVDLIHGFVTADVLAGIGIPNADVVSDIIVNVVDNCLLTDSREHIESDASAINDIMHFAMGDDNVSAIDLVHSLANSQTVCDTLVDMTGNQTITVSEQQKTDVAQAVEAYVNSPEYDAEKDATLIDAVKGLFGITTP